MFSPIESAPPSFAPRFAASIAPGFPRQPGSFPRERVLGVLLWRARRAEDRRGGAHVRERLEAAAQLLLDALEPSLVGERGQHRRLLGGDDLLVEGGGRALL